MVSRYLIFCTSCPRCFFFCTASLIRKCFPLTHYFRFKLYIIFNKKRDIEFSNSCPVTTASMSRKYSTTYANWSGSMPYLLAPKSNLNWFPSAAIAKAVALGTS